MSQVHTIEPKKKINIQKMADKNDLLISDRLTGLR